MDKKYFQNTFKNIDIANRLLFYKTFLKAFSQKLFFTIFFFKKHFRLMKMGCKLAYQIFQYKLLNLINFQIL